VLVMAFIVAMFDIRVKIAHVEDVIFDTIKKLIWEWIKHEIPLNADVQLGAEAGEPAAATGGHACGGEGGWCAANLDAMCKAAKEFGGTAVPGADKMLEVSTLPACVATNDAFGDDVLKACDGPDGFCSHAVQAVSGLTSRFEDSDAMLGATSGGGPSGLSKLFDGEIDFEVKMNGMLCMYVFCLAVVLSLLLGVYVDATNEKYEERLAGHGKRRGKDHQWRSFPPGPFRPTSCGRWVEYCLHISLVLLELALIIAAITTPLFKRVISGSLFEEIGEDVGIHLDEAYTLPLIAYRLGEFGGLNIIKSVVLCIFVIVGPLLRSLTMLLVLLCPMASSIREKLWKFSTHVSVFFAFEILIVAVPILSVTFYPVTSVILEEKNFPPCKYTNAKWKTDKCFLLDAQPLSAYLIVCVLVGVHIISGLNGSWTHKYVQWKLHPNDRPAPTLFCGCQNWSCCQWLVRLAPPIFYVPAETAEIAAKASLEETSASSSASIP